MTVSLEWLGGFIGVVGASVLFEEFVSSASPFVAYGAIIAGGFIGAALWVYSPLPNSNGGIASHDPHQGRYWGAHPGPRRTAPEYISEHKTDDRVIYYYEDDCVAVDRTYDLSAAVESAEKADELLRGKIQERDRS